MYSINHKVRKQKRREKLRERRRSMPALVEATGFINYTNSINADTQDPLHDLIVAMGKRLQAEYIHGAIPYLRRHEPVLWAKLEVLDQEETIDALLAYERLFFEGLRRYVSHLEKQRQAA
jgi:hypothetical protein